MVTGLSALFYYVSVSTVSHLEMHVQLLLLAYITLLSNDHWRGPCRCYRKSVRNCSTVQPLVVVKLG